MSDTDLFTRKKYDEEIERYDLILKTALQVSLASGGIKTSTRYIRSTQIFTRMVVIAYSFFRLMPSNTITHDYEEHWDWPSVASVARNFLEAYLHFFYIGVDKISDEEVDFRLKAMWFHLNSEKYRLYKSGPSDKDLSGFEENLPKEKNKLKQHPFFENIDTDHQRRALSGKSATYMTKKQLMARLPFRSDELCWMYRHLSNEVHSTAFAFNSLSNKRGRGNENAAERGYIISACWLVRKYLSAAIMDMAEIFPTKIGKKESEAVNSARIAFQEFMKEEGNA
jgi:hypothetical protein